MKATTLHTYQEVIFDLTIYASYALLLMSFMGVSAYVPAYLSDLDYYVRVYICLFLLWRFHPFRTRYEFTHLDRKIAFSAGAFILTTTALNQYLMDIRTLVAERLHPSLSS